MAVKVGKHTLESLTTGMYNDPKITYREYIQNSVDSIELAIRDGIITKQDSKIEIIIDNENRSLIIKDNGMGIRCSDVDSILINIGNSQKRHTSNRGFRGIGRLGGLSYCKKLKFITSYRGESTKTELEFNSKRLKELLVPGKYENYDMEMVLEEVTCKKEDFEYIDEHYFIVEMLDIDPFCGLLDLENVKSYLRQVAPLPYKSKFIWKEKINEVLKKNNVVIEDFNIFIGEVGSNLEQLFKANKDKFIANRNKNIKDELSDIRTFVIDDGNLVAVGWYGVCGLYGQIVNQEIRGLRVRKGNILIGDERLLNPIFREGRFNNYIQGEVFVITDNLIPNARRDDFESGEEYNNFLRLMTEVVGEEISKDIRNSSTNRSNPLKKKTNEVTKKINEVEKVSREGFNSKVEKESYSRELEKLSNDIASISVKTDDDKKIKVQTLHLLEEIKEEIDLSQKYKLNEINSLGKKEKKILNIVSDVLSSYLTKDTVDEIINELKSRLNKGAEK